MLNAKEEYQHYTCVQYLWERRKSVRQHSIKEQSTQESHSRLCPWMNNDGCERNLCQQRLKKEDSINISYSGKVP